MRELIKVTVDNVNGVLTTTSNRVAEELGVNHRDLMEKIDGYIKRFNKSNVSNGAAESSAHLGFYIPSSYVHPQNKCKYRNFLITKKGIAQLIGGYNSAVSKAFELNIAYINEFERMEEYIMESNKQKLPQTYLEALKELVKAEEEKQALESRVNNLIHAKKLYTTTEIAKELGFKSAIAFNKRLEEDKVQYCVNKTWVLCSKYYNKGYVSIKQTELDNGRIIYDRKWTGLGRDFLLEKYKSE